jgi:hypothetical protein
MAIHIYENEFIILKTLFKHKNSTSRFNKFNILE